MKGFEVAIAVAVCIVALTFAARRLSTPRPIVLAAGGLALGAISVAIPGFPRLTIDPHLILALVLPPLLLVAAFRVPLGAFRSSLRPITLLAVGLVLVTMALVALTARMLLPGLPWAAALALGAIVAPPDPVASTAVARQVGLSNRLVTILEGEGLVNDATALVAYQIAIAAAVSGEFSIGGVGIELARAVPVGIAIGLAIGWLSAQVRRRVDDPLLETATSLLMPYVAYIAADLVGGSGILAVVALGMFLRRRATELGSPSTRMVNRVVWQTVDFVVGGAVFAFIGIELGQIMAQGVVNTWILHAAAVAAVAIAVRLAWMYVVPEVTRRLPGASRDSAPTFGERAVLGWAGMRGVVTLALALAIPFARDDGSPFPARYELITISLGMVLITLLGQGLTLAPLSSWLKVGDPRAAERDERAARVAAERAAAARLDALARDGVINAAQRERLTERMRRDLGVAPDTASGRGRSAEADAGLEEAIIAAFAAEREAVLKRRNDGDLDEETAARLEAELDLDELALQGDVGRIVNR